MVKFSPDKDIPDLSGRVIIVTGGTDGLGKETVLQLSKHSPAHIYLAARSKSKADTCLEEIKAKSPNACPVSFLELNLASFDSIKAAAQTFQAAETRLDILIANAGVMGANGTTDDGYEITFGVNHVGHALFIKLLFPLMLKTAKEQPNTDVRLVILGSDAEKLANKNYYTLKPEEIKSNLASLSTFGKYGQSKLANAHFTQQLAKHYLEEEHHVKVSCVHPGAVYTNLGADVMPNWPTLSKVLRRSIGILIRMVPVEEGAHNQLWAAVAPGVKHGEFYHPVGLEGKGSARITDEPKAKELWDWTEKELNGHA